MKLIVGLGNPDLKYKNTFHNLGFMAIDKVAELSGAQFNKEKCRAKVAEFKAGGEKIILAKPLTYMNLSGESVRELLSFYKIDVSSLLVIYDDYDLPKGEIRIRENGSAGTHNGMKNIVQQIGSTNFPRIRIGFKQDGEFKIPLIDYVLSGIKDDDKPLFSKAIDTAGNAGYQFAIGTKLQDVMQKYNGKTTL